MVLETAASVCGRVHYVIETDDLLEAAPLEKTETEKHLEKKLRYAVHRQSVLAPEDRQHCS
jgi:hypothetical protein